MAITILSTVNTQDGLQFTNGYLRIDEFYVNDLAQTAQVKLNLYASQEAREQVPPNGNITPVRIAENHVAAIFNAPMILNLGATTEIGIPEGITKTFDAVKAVLYGMVGQLLGQVNAKILAGEIPNAAQISFENN